MSSDIKAAGLTVDSYRRINTICDEFRRLLKQRILESNQQSEDEPGYRSPTDFAREIGRSDWVNELEARNGRSDKAA